MRGQASGQGLEGVAPLDPARNHDAQGLDGIGSVAAAIVQQGTTNRQRVLIGTLASLPQLAQDAQLKPPTLIIVGEVVKLHDKLKWFDPAGAPDVGSWKQDKPGK